MQCKGWGSARRWCSGRQCRRVSTFQTKQGSCTIPSYTGIPLLQQQHGIEGIGSLWPIFFIIILPKQKFLPNEFVLDELPVPRTPSQWIESLLLRLWSFVLSTSAKVKWCEDLFIFQIRLFLRWAQWSRKRRHNQRRKNKDAYQCGAHREAMKGEPW